ncbi:MAG: hypothetical protein EXS49_00430 [Candidatus Pacebacteria bacterium]|nr:hypothetical protein [Candidatus Paceibacterota bacterium]
MKTSQNKGFAPILGIIIGVIAVLSLGAVVFVAKHNTSQNSDQIIKNEEVKNNPDKTVIDSNISEKKAETKTIIKKTEIPGLCIPELAIQTDLPADRFYFEMDEKIGKIIKDNSKTIIIYPIYNGSPEKMFLNQEGKNQSSFISKNGKLKVYKTEDTKTKIIDYLVQSSPYQFLIYVYNEKELFPNKDKESEKDLSLFLDTMINKKCEKNPINFKENIIKNIEDSKPINIWLGFVSQITRNNLNLAYSILKSSFDIDTRSIDEVKNLEDYYFYAQKQKSENSYYEVFLNKAFCSDYIIYKTVSNIPQYEIESFIKNKLYKENSQYKVEEQMYNMIKSSLIDEKLEEEIGKEKIDKVKLVSNYFEQPNNWDRASKLTGEYCKNAGIPFP